MAALVCLGPAAVRCRARTVERSRQSVSAAAAPQLAARTSVLRSARLRTRPATARPGQVFATLTVPAPAPERAPGAPALPQLPPTLPPAKTFEAAVNMGGVKSTFSLKKLAVLSFIAGCQIGFGALLMTVVGGGSPAVAAANPGLGKWLSGAIGLPLGLMMVLLTGGELFTGNVFIMLSGFLNKKVTSSQLAMNWAVSFLGNFAGSLCLAGLAYMAGTTAVQPWLSTTISVATFKATMPFSVAFTRGLMCNWMVCTAVWVATAAQSAAGKFLGIWILVSSMVAMGFEHSIANMFIIPLGMLNGAPITPSQFILNNLVPVTLGNIVGGAVLVAGVYSFAYGTKD